MQKAIAGFTAGTDFDIKSDSIIYFCRNNTDNNYVGFGGGFGLVFDSVNLNIKKTPYLYQKDTNGMKIVNIRRIKHTLKDTIWLASVDSGIIKYDMKKNWTYYDKSNSPLFSNIVPYMDINRKTNEKWFVCARGFNQILGAANYAGLAKLSDSGWTLWDTLQTPFYTPKNFIFCNIFSINIDSSGALWLGIRYEYNNYYSTCIYCYKDGWTKFDSTNSPISTEYYYGNYPQCIYTDKKGVVWVGMSDALCKYQNGTWTRYEYPYNKNGHWVKSMAKDTNNNIWLSDNGNFSIFNEDSIKGEILVIDFQGKSVEEPSSVLSTFSVSPNPFTAQLAISYTLPQPAQTSLSLCDIQGNEVAIIAPEQQSEGTVNLYYDASALPAGSPRRLLKCRI
ncbi:MAG: hypothetical protein NT007_07070 [Candidatus Kapabacteria bacterium]|nr:hypothetical protein [Candidatus Kapabacteria bacterium]